MENPQGRLEIMGAQSSRESIDSVRKKTNSSDSMASSSSSSGSGSSVVGSSHDAQYDDSRPSILDYFPEELSLFTLSFLNSESLLRFSSVSRDCRRIANDFLLWKRLCEYDYPGSVPDLGLGRRIECNDDNADKEEGREGSMEVMEYPSAESLNVVWKGLYQSCYEIELPPGFISRFDRVPPPLFRKDNQRSVKIILQATFGIRDVCPHFLSKFDPKRIENDSDEDLQMMRLLGLSLRRQHFKCRSSGEKFQCVLWLLSMTRDSHNRRMFTSKLLKFFHGAIYFFTSRDRRTLDWIRNSFPSLDFEKKDDEENENFKSFRSHSVVVEVLDPPGDFSECEAVPSSEVRNVIRAMGFKYAHFTYEGIQSEIDARDIMGYSLSGALERAKRQDEFDSASICRSTSSRFSLFRRKRSKGKRRIGTGSGDG